MAVFDAGTAPDTALFKIHVFFTGEHKLWVCTPCAAQVTSDAEDSRADSRTIFRRIRLLGGDKTFFHFDQLHSFSVRAMIAS